VDGTNSVHLTGYDSSKVRGNKLPPDDYRCQAYCSTSVSEVVTTVGVYFAEFVFKNKYQDFSVWETNNEKSLALFLSREATRGKCSTEAGAVFRTVVFYGK